MKHWYGMLLIPVLSVSGQDTHWTADEAMLLYFDAATAIRRQALEPHELQDIVTGSLAGYAKTLDPHSRFFTADEYARWTRSQSSDYAGVGMELAADREGRFICLPYPGSPAEEAGIRDGDQLLAVNGVANGDLDLVSVGMQVRGVSDSPVSLQVQLGNRAPREVEIVRRKLRAPSLVSLSGTGVQWIRIYRFTASTTAELASALGGTDPMVIDLRGNPGGSLYDAMDAAGLFLGEGVFIAGVRTRDGLREHRATKPARFPDGNLWLLQDDRTASSAELFIAALTGHGRARSLGTRTVGKGSTQSMIPLTDGAALLLTVGELVAPGGIRYDGVGLEPTLPLALESERLEEQVRQVLNDSP